MDNRPIGVFDSGLGGLTVVRRLLELLPAEDGLEQVSLAGMADTPIRLGEDEYFLLGDNRDSSEDSRFANIGNVKRGQIQGKVWFRILPLIHS